MAADRSTTMLLNLDTPFAKLRRVPISNSLVARSLMSDKQHDTESGEGAYVRMRLNPVQPQQELDDEIRHLSPNCDRGFRESQ